jgi:1-acyl-sn-glycerol-3-phosphate acyltransferase
VSHQRAYYTTKGIIVCAALYRVLMVALLAVLTALLTPIQPGWHQRNCRWVLRGLLRVTLWCLGFWWVRILGVADETAQILVSNHITLIEGAFLCFYHGAGIVSAVENNRGLTGCILRALGTVFVDRSRHGSGTVQQIHEQLHGKQRIIVFPEGLCGNGLAIMPFQSGAFAVARPSMDVPGQAVLPIAVKYHFSHMDPSWANVGPTYADLVWRMMFSVYNTLEVIHLPLSYAGDAETPKQHAERVRGLIAHQLGIPFTSFTREDNALGTAAKRAGYPGSVGHIGWLSVQRERSALTFEAARSALGEYLRSPGAAKSASQFRASLLA